MRHASIEAAAMSACESVGIHYKPFPACEKFHVVDAIEGKKGNGAGRLKFFSDGQGGIAFNFKTGQQQAFFINGKQGEPTPPAELERIKKEQQRREAETLKGYDRAARRAGAIWQAAKPAPLDHPYLITKQIKPHGARLGSWQRTIEDESGKRKKLIIENSLILPMYNADGKIRSLQAIFPEKHPLLGRNKDFLPGGQGAGLFWWIGPNTDKVLICEGFATAATLQEETDNRVYMALSASNLIVISLIIREKLPNAEIVICSDNDKTSRNKNPGLTAANAAAEAIGASLAVPPIIGDFNDYAIFLRDAGNG